MLCSIKAGGKFDKYIIGNLQRWRLFNLLKEITVIILFPLLVKCLANFHPSKAKKKSCSYPSSFFFGDAWTEGGERGKGKPPEKFKTWEMEMGGRRRRREGDRQRKENGELAKQAKGGREGKWVGWIDLTPFGFLPGSVNPR